MSTSKPSAEVGSSIDPGAWNRFAQAGTQDEYCRSWLALQCTLVEAAILGVVVLRDGDQAPYRPVAKWPEAGDGGERLAELAERVISERGGLLVESGPHYGMGYPILVDEVLLGVVVLEIEARGQVQLQGAMGQLRWGAGWLELWFRRRRASEDGQILERLRRAVDLFAGVLAEPRFAGASMTYVTELATQLKCDRVSMGFVRRGHAVVQAVSHSAQFGKRMNLTRTLGAAMDEAIVQGCEIHYPQAPGDEALVVRDHEQLARQHGVERVLTFPLYSDERYYGALVFERQAETPFGGDEIEFCRSVCGLAGPVLEEKRLNDRLLPVKVASSCRLALARLLGAGYLGRKLLVLAAVVLALFFVFAQGEYRIAAHSVLEGEVLRAVVAPFNSYIKEAAARAGDVVEEGQLICALDDRDLVLDQSRWQSQQTQLQRQVQEALAAGDRARVLVLGAQLEQTRAQLELVEGRLGRTRLRAPFAGLVTSGDLSQRLGGLVEKGEVLFEVTPLDAYRLILEVDERRIADVSQGQRGQLLLAALPRQPFEFTIDKITPLAVAREGRNYFRVEARLDNLSPQLRPGMEGVGKIDVDRRRLWDIWTRDLSEWLRLRLWAWWT